MVTIPANKRLGQNFLANKGIIAKIIDAAALTSRDTVLEIGPGLGAITLPLAARAKKIVAVEKDKRLVEALHAALAEHRITNVAVISGDIMRLLEKNAILLPEHYTVVANIPYYLTSALIRQLLERKQKPRRMLLMIQKEVAQRIVAHNGKESIFSLAVKFYADARILFYVSRGSFIPMPKVDSAIIEIVPHKKWQKINAGALFSVVKVGFSAPRKKLAGNLAGKLGKSREIISAALTSAGISPDARAETVSLTQWVALAHHIHKML